MRIIETKSLPYLVDYCRDYYIENEDDEFDFDDLIEEIENRTD